MERGHYGVEATNGEPALADAVDRATRRRSRRSRLIIDNEFMTDLEPELWNGDEITEEIKEAGQRLGDLDLLPAPFPIEDLLDERDLRHVKRLYGIGGLSYGNLSARKDDAALLDERQRRRQVEAREPGRDILLVSGYDEENGRMLLSVPPNVEPRRVSVDAIEHWMIYQAHPDVGAILHVHAWMDGHRRRRTSTTPAARIELARERRRAARAGAGSRPRRHRPAQPRHHGDRRRAWPRSSTASSRRYCARSR